MRRRPPAARRRGAGRRRARTPIVLGPKEGLALINGTQFSTACALAGLFRAWRNRSAGLVVSAPLDRRRSWAPPRRSSPRSTRCAATPARSRSPRAMRALMDGSAIRESHREGDARVQDPYCIRCQPQVTGAALDLLRFAARTLRDRGQRRHRQPAGPGGRRPHRLGRQLPRRAGRLRRRPDRAGHRRDRRHRPAARRADGRPDAQLRPAAVPDARAGAEFRPDDRRGHHRGADEREQASRHPCSTNSTPTSANQEDHVSHGRPWRAAAGADEREPGA